MATLTINGRRVKVDDSFLSLTPEQQNSTVDEIAQSLGGQQEPQRSDAYNQAAGEMSAMTQAFGNGPEGNPVADRQRAQYDALPEWQKPLVAAGDTLQLFANGATMGFGDKAVAAARAPFTDKTYEQELAAARTLTQEARNRARGAGMGAEIAGAVATPMKLAGKGATLAGRFGTAAMTGAPGVLARTGLMAAEGAGYGGLTAAGNDQDIGTGTAIGAAGGALGNLAGEALSAGVSKIAGKFNPKVPPMGVDDLKAASNAAYSRAEQAGVAFNQNGVNQLRTNIIQDLTSRGYHPTNEPGVKPVLDYLAKVGNGNITLKGLDTLRKVASNGFQPGNQSNNATLTQIIGRIDELVNAADPSTVLMGSNPQAAANALQEARGMWGRAKKLETVQELLDRAGLNAGSAGAGGNVENASRQQIKRLLTNPNLKRGLTKAEQDAARKAVLGSRTQNAFRLAGGMSPTTGKLTAFLTGAGALTNPAVGVPAMIAGYGAKKTAEHLSRKSVAELVSLISSGGVPEPVMKNAIQLLAESKRDALTRALMAIAVNRGNARYNEPNHQEQP
ncbi:hypothetical protein ASD64_01270 [Mesorhizobium sp. Root157]|uniref:hypothetical protein n=1 Tax=Mesorhizobium sp. Root157 TaxID=1736477 RepID=UPI0006F6C415|nr:hypothetical protein [Mesorhizobium sp. Root157]KRA00233.1 hypothetical protein ASD64_01270 [Mesorhizobium sp. Root157]